jgi:hypothetical protein
MNIVFRKSGKDIKAAVQKRREQLQLRLNRRNQTLDEFLQDPRKVRSYMTRSANPEWSHYRQRGYTLFSNEDISSEEMEEIAQLCHRIYQIEQEIHQLELVLSNLEDSQVFDLSFEDLVAYGFEANLESE